MKKKSIVKEVAKFIAFYDGDSEQENMELARQIVAKVKRHLTSRAADGVAEWVCKGCKPDAVDPSMCAKCGKPRR